MTTSLELFYGEETGYKMDATPHCKPHYSDITVTSAAP